MKSTIDWGLTPCYITGDSWYSSVENLKHIKKEGLGFILDSDFAHSPVWLRVFGYVRLFRTRLKDQVRYYVLFEPTDSDDSNKPDVTSLIVHFGFLHSVHWCIERFHRALKQVCSIEKFQVRRKRLVLNHVFASILGFIYLSTMVTTMYRWHSKLFRPVVAKVCYEVDSQWAHLRSALA